MKTLVGLALGTLLSLGAATAAFAAGPNVPAPAHVADEGIEVIVVTAKQPAAQAVSTEAQIYELVVTAKSAAKTKIPRTPPAMAIEVPKIQLARGEPPALRL